MKLSCREIDPKSNCNFEATGSNAEEVADKMMAHLHKAHPDKVTEMNLTGEEMRDMLLSKAHE